MNEPRPALVFYADAMEYRCGTCDELATGYQLIAVPESAIYAVSAVHRARRVVVRSLRVLPCGHES